MASFDPSTEYVTSVESMMNSQSAPYLVNIDKIRGRASRRQNRIMSGDGLSDLYSLEMGYEEEKIESRRPLTCTEPHRLSFSALPAQESEHIDIAARLSNVHKYHVDRIMEILRIEVDALRDIDRLLEDSGCLTEEEVLDYFECIGRCLDQRSQTGAHLQSELDLISRGAPSL